jgi:hypothetical protein
MKIKIKDQRSKIAWGRAPSPVQAEHSPARIKTEEEYKF